MFLIGDPVDCSINWHSIFIDIELFCNTKKKQAVAAAQVWSKESASTKRYRVCMVCTKCLSCQGTSTDQRNDLRGSPRGIDLRSNVDIGTPRLPFRYIFRHVSLKGTWWRAYELSSSKAHKVLAFLAKTATLAFQYI